MENALQPYRQPYLQRHAVAAVAKHVTATCKYVTAASYCLAAAGCAGVVPGSTRVCNVPPLACVGPQAVAHREGNYRAAALQGTEVWGV